MLRRTNPEGTHLILIPTWKTTLIVRYEVASIVKCYFTTALCSNIRRSYWLYAGVNRTNSALPVEKMHERLGVSSEGSWCVRCPYLNEVILRKYRKGFQQETESFLYADSCCTIP